MKISYSIISLEEICYNIDFDIKNKSIDKSGIGFRLGHKIETDQEGSNVIVSIYVYLADKETNIRLFKEGVRAVFHVEPFNEVIKSIDDDGIGISYPALIDTFISVTIGAARGFITKNLKGTPLDGCVLPLIPMDTIRNNLTRKEE